MRARIAERGLTGGWFGDPPPGRSALDELRSGIIRPPAPTYATRYTRKPTLATKVTL
jgi:hypothetical protein